MKSPLTYAKIVATPTLSSWSQAYNAGNLAAVIALTQKPLKNEDGEEAITTDVSLASLGKELLNTLEAEYFTLESKNLNSIKQAITTTCEKVEEGIDLSLMVSVIIENILYVFIYGNGKILMKRSGKLGVLLEQKEKDHLTAASGFIQSGDIVILETEQFSDVVSPDILLPCLEHDKLQDITEALSPVIHENQGSAAAALVFSYKEEGENLQKENFTTIETPEKPVGEKIVAANLPEKMSEEVPGEKEDISISSAKEEDRESEQIEEGESSSTQAIFHESQLRKSRGTMQFSHKKKVLLTIVVILVIILGISIYYSMKKQEQTKLDALVASSIVPAQKKYDEGQSLIDLNKNLAREDFQTAKDTLSSAVSKFPKDSKEEKQALDLMQKIDTSIVKASQINTADAKEVDSASSEILSALIKHQDGKYAAIDSTNVYVGNNNAITAIPKNGGKEKTAIDNSGDWKDIGGLGAYLGNLYVVDKKDGIIKYVGGKSSGKANYFTTSPDLTNVTSMAIDGSIWLLSTDGTISKYTRGKQDNFAVSGLDKPLVGPTRISTSVDMNNVYILDNGNKRIVVLDKSGNYISQYQSDLLGTAQDFDVVEKNKIVYFLSGGKVYQIDLK